MDEVFHQVSGEFIIMLNYRHVFFVLFPFKYIFISIADLSLTAYLVSSRTGRTPVDRLVHTESPPVYLPGHGGQLPYKGTKKNTSKRTELLKLGP